MIALNDGKLDLETECLLEIALHVSRSASKPATVERPKTSQGFEGS